MHDSEEPQGPQVGKSKSSLSSAHELECILGQPSTSGCSAKPWIPILHSSTCCGATAQSRLARLIVAKVGSASPYSHSQRDPHVRNKHSRCCSFLALVHRFPPVVDSCFIPCSGSLMVLDSHVHLTAGLLVTSSYKLVMLRIRRGTSMSGVEFCARSKTLSSSVLF